jgi:ubiquinone/menaquinone biosynthesis C-methylase UbiE
MSPWLVPILRCPETGLGFDERSGVLTRSDGAAFPERDGVVSLVDSAALVGTDARMNRLYERLAPVYDFSERVLGRLIAGVDIVRERRRIVELLGLAPGRRFLEVSPGPGVFQPWLRAALGPAAEYAAVDLSRAMLRECRRRHSALGIELVQADAQHLPFADASFDALFHMGGVNLFNDPAGALAEFVRVVRPGGLVSWGDEQMSDSYRRSHSLRRKLLERINPGFLATPPVVPDTLTSVVRHEVSEGLGYLVVARRAA